jgi:SAM-dependent methyltransferase
MSSIREHYEQLLAPVYSWMSGDAEHRLDANRAFFRHLGLRPGSTGAALDLGAGSGFQSIPLAELGFQVTAVDLSPTLLAELTRGAGALPIRTLERDLFPIRSLASGPVELVVCMGDTLTHLHDLAQVRSLVAESAAVLAPAGVLVLTWRDLTQLPEGDARFLHIRSSSERLFTCFLEGVDRTHVRVHDIVHERAGDGFAQRIGSYLKLRIAPEWVDAELNKCGLVLDTATAAGGWITRVARRPAP